MSNFFNVQSPEDFEALQPEWEEMQEYLAELAAEDGEYVPTDADWGEFGVWADGVDNVADCWSVRDRAMLL